MISRTLVIDHIDIWYISKYNCQTLLVHTFEVQCDHLSKLTKFVNAMIII